MFERLKKWWEKRKYEWVKARCIKRCNKACMDEEHPDMVLAAYPAMLWWELEADRYFEGGGLKMVQAAWKAYPGGPFPEVPNPRQHILDEIEEAPVDQGDKAVLEAQMDEICGRVHKEHLEGMAVGPPIEERF